MEHRLKNPGNLEGGGKQAATKVQYEGIFAVMKTFQVMTVSKSISTIIILNYTFPKCFHWSKVNMKYIGPLLSHIHRQQSTITPN